MAYVIISYDSEEIARQNLKGTILVGRCPECDISVHDILLSRKHCRLTCSRDQWRVTDLASRNGTRVNDHRIDKHDLADGDSIRVGNTTLEFHVGIAPPLRATGKKKIERPTDPHEALAGTVFAHEAIHDDGEPSVPATLAGRPVPRPAPLPPRAYEQEGVNSMVLNMLSDLHDSMLTQLQTKPRQPVARPIVRNLPPKPPSPVPVVKRARPVMEPSPITETGPLLDPSSAEDIPSSPILDRAVKRTQRIESDDLEQGAAAVATLAPPAPAPRTSRQAQAKSQAADGPAPAKPTPAKKPRRVAISPAPIFRRRPSRFASLDLWMCVLLVWALAAVIFATRTLFQMS